MRCRHRSPPPRCPRGHDEHPTLAPIELGSTADALADVYDQARRSVEEGRLSDAEALLRQTLALEERAFGPAHPECASTLAVLASVLHELDRCEEAVALYQLTLVIEKRWLDPRSEELAKTQHNLAAAYSDLRSLGRLEEAALLYQRALALCQTTPAAGDSLVGGILHNQAVLLQQQGCYEEAERLFLRALAGHDVSNELDTWITSGRSAASADSTRTWAHAGGGAVLRARAVLPRAGADERRPHHRRAARTPSELAGRAVTGLA